jgi:hypothetical protein
VAEILDSVSGTSIGLFRAGCSFARHGISGGLRLADQFPRLVILEDEQAVQFDGGAVRLQPKDDWPDIADLSERLSQRPSFISLPRF